MQFTAVILMLGAVLCVDLAFVSTADAQSYTVRCKIRPDLPASFCCKQCVAWGKAPAGSLVGPCVKWTRSNGKCPAASGVR